MKLMRNPQFKRNVILSAVFGGIFTVLGFLQGALAGFTVGIAVTVIIAVFLGSEAKHYEELKELCTQIHDILVGGEALKIENTGEGEVSVLTSEVNKLFIRLKEQNDSLLKEKLLLCDFLADVSHQLKTPLTGMSLVIALLREPDLAEQRRMELIRQLYTLLSDTELLIGCLLKTAQLDADAVSLKKETVSVRDLIGAAMRDLEITLDVKDITLICEHHNAFFTGDMQWSTQALGNIMKNCAEHTPVGGKITVTAEETPIYTRITVTDSGKGFQQEDIPHLFERFYKGQNAGENSYGIGLNLARSIIQKQNGTVKAYNKNGGACFDIKLYKTVV